MKKIYLLAGLALVSGMSFAQANRNDASSLYAKPGVAPGASKAPLDTVTMETFDATPMGSGGWTTWGAWTATNQNDHTSGDWYLETTFPASLSGQPQIPFTAFTGEMSGNVAFINSDAEGGSAFQDALYTSPAIDLSAMGTTPLSLRYQSQWRRFQELHYIYVSNDNGATWTEFQVDVVDVNTNSDDPQYAELNISSANGGGSWGTQVMIRYRYDAQWDWFWAVDNVAIIETPADDLQISDGKDFFAGKKISYSRIPSGQLAPMQFTASATNNGAADQTTSQLDVTVSGAGTFSGSSTSQNVATGTTASFSVTGFTPAAVGTYDITYNVYDPATTDANPLDNVMTGSFEVTNNLWGKSGAILDGWWGPFDDDGDGIDDPIELFPEFELNATATAYRLKTVVMGGGTTPQTPVGQEIYYNMGYDDGTGNIVMIYDGLTLPVPTKILAASELTAASGSEVWVDLDFPTPVAMDVALGDLWYPFVGYSIDSAFFAVSGDAADTSNFMNVFASTAGQTGYFITSVPMLDIDFNPVSVNEEEANVELGQNVPNPFDGTTMVPFSLVNAADVEFIVTDMTGKIIETRSLGTLSSGQHSVSFDGSGLASGFYHYSLIVDGKRTTKKMSVTK